MNSLHIDFHWLKYTDHLLVFLCLRKFEISSCSINVFQECPCLVDRELLSSLQSVSTTPVSSLLIHNVSEGMELQSGDNLVHDCSSW